LIGLAGVLAIGACDDDDDFVGVPVPTGGVATFKDSTFDFTTLLTYAMPDTVVHFEPVTGTPIAISRAWDATILDRLRADFLTRGYVQVTDPSATTPDFVVLVGATATENYNAYVSYAWYGTWGFYPGWGWYAPGFDTTWGIVYPWYPYVGVTAYDRGTVLVTLIPTRTVNPLQHSIGAAWAGAATALLNGTVTTDIVNTAIDAMFIQSPYLSAPTPTPLARTR
jgi:hypothetical protein